MEDFMDDLFEWVKSSPIVEAVEDIYNCIIVEGDIK
jgi:hypothetical protein